MLGEKIGEATGKTMLERVVPGDGGAPRMEVTFQEMGTMLGVPTKDTGTYTVMLRPDGTL